MTVDYGADELRVEVTDTGRGLTSPAAAYAAVITGSGITGSGITGSGITGSGIGNSALPAQPATDCAVCASGPTRRAAP